MKKLITILVLLITLNSFSQTYVIQRVAYGSPGNPNDTIYREIGTNNMYRYNGTSYDFAGSVNSDDYGSFLRFTSLPTTLSGYGITDAYTKTQSDAQYASLTGSYANPSWITSYAYSKLTGTPSVISFNTITSISSGGRNFNQGYQISTTKYSDIRVSVSISNSLTLSGGSSGQVFLETSPDNATWTTMGMTSNASTGTVIVGISTGAIGGGQLSCVLPPNSYWRLRTNNVSGTASYTMTGGVEILYN